MNFDEMKQRMATGKGFIAALDQSGGSTPKALAAYGVAEDEWEGEEEMFAQIHKMRCRIVDSPSFSNGKVLGAILFEKTMNGCSGDGSPIPELLARRGVVMPSPSPHATQPLPALPATHGKHKAWAVPGWW